MEFEVVNIRAGEELEGAVQGGGMEDPLFPHPLPVCMSSIFHLVVLEFYPFITN